MAIKEKNTNINTSLIMWSTVTSFNTVPEGGSVNMRGPEKFVP